MSWHLTLWGIALGGLCWLFVRMWTDSPSAGAAARRRAERGRKGPVRHPKDSDALPDVPIEARRE
jgi:hypothetical protein